MQSLAALVDEFRDHGIGLRRFQKLNARLAHWQHRRVDFFDGYGFAQRNSQAKLIAVELERLIDRAHSDPEMIDLSA